MSENNTVTFVEYAKRDEEKKITLLEAARLCGIDLENNISTNLFIDDLPFEEIDGGVLTYKKQES